MNESRLVYHRNELPLNARFLTFSIDGNGKMFIVNDETLLIATGKIPKIGGVVQVGPFRIRLIERDYQRKGFLAIRESWLGIPRLYGHRLELLGEELKGRFIITLYVWGLAERTDFYPRWSDIKLIRWIKNKAGIYGTNRDGDTH